MRRERPGVAMFLPAPHPMACRIFMSRFSAVSQTPHSSQSLAVSSICRCRCVCHASLEQVCMPLPLHARSRVHTHTHTHTHTHAHVHTCLHANTHTGRYRQARKPAAALPRCTHDTHSLTHAPAHAALQANCQHPAPRPSAAAWRRHVAPPGLH